MLRVALIDDEALARQALRQLLQEVPEIEIVGEADSAPRGRQLIESLRPDAIFLDIQMPGMNGFEVLRHLDQPPAVVFVTAHSEHAVQAFEIDAVDYLLKPVRASRLVAAIRRLELACGPRTGSLPPWSPLDRICLNTPQRTLVARMEDIVFLEADGDFTQVHVAGEASLMICKPLRSYAEILPSPPFVKLDRSVILNRDALIRSEKVSRDEERIWLRGKPDPVILGRTAKTRLRQVVEKI